MYSVYWSLETLVFYLILALVGMWCMNYIKQDTMKFSFKNTIRNKYAIIWIGIWTFFATFRLVNWEIGGSDAPNYIYFFENCNISVYSSWMEHVGDDFIFKWINKSIRYMTADYHLYFALIYAFMTYASICFAKKFTKPEFNIAPYVLVFFLFLRSFSSIRSNLAIAFILIACVCFANNETRKAYVWAIASVFVHKASALFAFSIPFIHFFLRKDFNVKYTIILIIISSFLGTVFQGWFIQYTSEVDLSGAYGYYAARSLEGGGFFDNAWKIAFEQMFLAFNVALNSKRINQYINAHFVEGDSKTLKVLWLLCMFDFILIPVNFILGIWRGYEYMYIPRIVMWGLLLQFYTQKDTNSKIVMTTIFTIAFIAWMSFRIERTYEDTCLMPYIFEPLIN